MVAIVGAVAMVFTFGTPLSYGIFRQPLSDALGLASGDIERVFDHAVYVLHRFRRGRRDCRPIASLAASSSRVRSRPVSRALAVRDDIVRWLGRRLRRARTGARQRFRLGRVDRPALVRRTSWCRDGVNLRRQRTRTVRPTAGVAVRLGDVRRTSRIPTVPVGDRGRLPLAGVTCRRPQWTKSSRRRQWKTCSN